MERLVSKGKRKIVTTAANQRTRNDMGIFSSCSTGANTRRGLEVTARLWESDGSG